MDIRSVDGKEEADGRADGRDGRQAGLNDGVPNGFEEGMSAGLDAMGYGPCIDVSSVFDILQRLSGRGVAEDAIDHSLNWLILSAWRNLDKMKELQNEMINRLQEIKKATGILN
ncbi:MAG: hypothetical protein L7F77_03475 [Candidatus Magnetominusculus sp. LBB02]|nr:hypothetical protein [Candidatus Magnetominusculus sp. LBB02]